MKEYECILAAQEQQVKVMFHGSDDATALSLSLSESLIKMTFPRRKE